MDGGPATPGLHLEVTGGLGPGSRPGGHLLHGHRAR